MFRSTKTFGHDLGLSCAFRQWRAEHSHCRFLHGYAIAVHLEFEATELDSLNWVVDFGGLKSLKDTLQAQFDHKTLVAKDDPEIGLFMDAATRGVMDVVVVDHVGCERFAELVWVMTDEWLANMNYGDRVRIVSVEIREHGANSAKFSRDGTW